MLRRIPILLILASLIFTLSFTTILIPRASSAESPAPTPGLPEVNIALQDTSKTAHVGPEDTCEVEFNGTVSVSCNPLTTVVVSLNAEDSWGSSKVNPSSMMFSQSGEQPFIVKVEVRPRESASNIGTVTVTGRWELIPSGLTGPANPQQGAVGRIDIAQYSEYTLKSPKAFKETSPGEDVEFELCVQNRGNGVDRFTIEIDNENEINDKDYDVSLNRTQLEIPENPAESFIKVSVKVPSSSKIIGHTTIIIKVTSELGASQNSPCQSFSFVIRIPDEDVIYTPEFSIIMVIIIGIVFVCIFVVWRRRKNRLNDENLKL